MIAVYVFAGLLSLIGLYYIFYVPSDLRDPE